MSQFVDSQVRVKCLGGRELRGSLRGYDELVNLVLDDCEEFIRGERKSFIFVYLTLTQDNILSIMHMFHYEM